MWTSALLSRALLPPAGTLAALALRAMSSGKPSTHMALIKQLRERSGSPISDVKVWGAADRTLADGGAASSLGQEQPQPTNAVRMQSRACCGHVPTCRAAWRPRTGTQRPRSRRCARRAWPPRPRRPAGTQRRACWGAWWPPTDAQQVRRARRRRRWHVRRQSLPSTAAPHTHARTHARTHTRTHARSGGGGEQRDGLCGPQRQVPGARARRGGRGAQPRGQQQRGSLPAG